MTTLLLLWALTGGGLSSTVMMLIWLPDPPPDLAGRFIGALIAGIIGGILGGYLVHPAAMGPLTEMVAAAGGGAILSAGVALLTAKRATAGH